MPGKIDASLNEKLANVEWGEYELGDLFDIESTSSFNADSLVDGNDYDYVTRTSINQGVLCSTGFVNKENLNDAGVWSLGLLQMDFFYRQRKWYAGQFVRKIVPKIEIPIESAPFFSVILNQQKPILLSVLVRNVDEKFRSLKVLLPTKDGKIDFEFMADFINEIELERINPIASHLKSNGLDDDLTEEEKNFLGCDLSDITLALSRLEEKLNSSEWNECVIGNLFERVETNKLPYKAADLPDSPKDNYVLPCLTSSFRNQGLNYYVPRDGATVLSNVISIPSNSDVYRAYYQPRDFTVLSDSYAVKWKDNSHPISPNQYMFFVQCINKITDLRIYSYKNKLGGWNVVKKKKIEVPFKDGQMDLNMMELFVGIVKKLMIRNVREYIQKKQA